MIEGIFAKQEWVYDKSLMRSSINTEAYMNMPAYGQDFAYHYQLQVALSSPHEHIDFSSRRYRIRTVDRMRITSHTY